MTFTPEMLFQVHIKIFVMGIEKIRLSELFF